MRNIETRLSKLEQKTAGDHEPPMVVLLRIVAPGRLNPRYDIITDRDGRKWRRHKGELSEKFISRVENEAARPGKVTLLVARTDKTKVDQ